MSGPAGDPTLESERNSKQQHRRLLVASLAPKPHLRLVTTQSQEQLASKHFELPPAFAKVRARRPERRVILPREAGARFRQSTPETGPQQPPPQPGRARQMPTPFAANAAVGAGWAAELLS